MNLFHQIENAQVILRVRGVFKQVDVFKRAYPDGENLFAKSSGGYIRLIAEGKTSIPNIMWEDIDVQYSLGEFQRLVLA